MNKNQKRLRASLRKSGGELAVEVPAGGYHNSAKGQWQTRRLNISKGGGVITASPRRNMQQRVLTNTGGGTLTVHEAIDPTSPVSYKNHGYLSDDYRQPKTVAA